MFGISPTPFDVRLIAFRVPIRVHPSFWIAATVLSWDPDHVDVVFLWVMCLFISIVVHELGHALMAEAFGWASEIVLYWLGGLTFSNRYFQRTPWREIAVSLAGPFAGFGLYGLTFAAMQLIPDDLDLHRNVYITLIFLIQINLYWGLVNLLPVWPLDGGQVCQSLLTWCRLRDPVRPTLYISVIVSAAAAIYFFNQGSRSFAGMLFAMLCLNNVVSLQQQSPR